MFTKIQSFSTKQLNSVHTRTFLRVWRNLTEVLVDRTFCISVRCIFHRKSSDAFRLGLPKNLHRSLFLVLWKNMRQVFIENEVKRVKHKLCLLIFYRQCTALKLLCLIDVLAVIWCVLLNCRTNDARKKAGLVFCIESCGTTEKLWCKKENFYRQLLFAVSCACILQVN